MSLISRKEWVREKLFNGLHESNTKMHKLQHSFTKRSLILSMMLFAWDFFNNFCSCYQTIKTSFFMIVLLLHIYMSLEDSFSIKCFLGLSFSFFLSLYCWRLDFLILITYFLEILYITLSRVFFCVIIVDVVVVVVDFLPSFLNSYLKPISWLLNQIFLYILYIINTLIIITFS